MKKFILASALTLAALTPTFGKTNSNLEYVVVTNKTGNHLFCDAIEYGSDAVKIIGDKVLVTTRNYVTPKEFNSSDISEISITDYPVADVFDMEWEQKRYSAMAYYGDDKGHFNLPIEGNSYGPNCVWAYDRLKINTNNPYGINCPTFNSKYGDNDYYKTISYLNIPYSHVADAFNATLADGFTAECIFKLGHEISNTNGVGTIFSSAYKQAGFDISISDNLKFITGTVYDTNGDKYRALSTATEYIEPNKYYHLIMTYDNSKGKISIYIDNIDNKFEKLGTNTEGEYSFRPVNDKNYQKIIIGADTELKNAFNGQVVCARIYDPVLQEDEIETLFERSKSLAIANGFDADNSIYGSDLPESYQDLNIHFDIANPTNFTIPYIAENTQNMQYIATVSKKGAYRPLRYIFSDKPDFSTKIDAGEYTISGVAFPAVSNNIGNPYFIKDEYLYLNGKNAYPANNSSNVVFLNSANCIVGDKASQQNLTLSSPMSQIRIFAEDQPSYEVGKIVVWYDFLLTAFPVREGKANLETKYSAQKVCYQTTPNGNLIAFDNILLRHFAASRKNIEVSIEVYDKQGNFVAAHSNIPIELVEGKTTDITTKIYTVKDRLSPETGAQSGIIINDGFDETFIIEIP